MSETVSVVATLGALGAVLALSVEGFALVGVNLVVGAWNGTLVFEASMSRGGTPVWFAIEGIDVASGGVVSSAIAAGNVRSFDVSACSQFRVRVSVWVAGTATVTVQGSDV